MDHPPPPIYIFHGEDDFAIALEIAGLKARLGAERPIDLDFTSLDPGAYSLDDLNRIVLTVPFLTKRRLVVANSPVKQFSDEKNREKFCRILDSVPDQTALVLVESTSLKPNHWLLQWSRARPERVYEQRFSLETGRGLSKWIRGRAQARGGEFSQEAADALAEMTGPEKRHASQEIDKLLAYTGWQRAVEVEDLRLLATGLDEEATSKVFEMVDTLGARKPREAMDLLHQLVPAYDPGYLFHMIVRQFRFLILAREAFEDGLGGSDLADRLNVKPWIASKILTQAHQFDLESLEEIYRRLLELDQAVKTSQSDYLLGLDTLIASTARYK